MPKTSLFIPTSRGNQEQARSQNYRSDIWISDLSLHSAPGSGLVSSIVRDINVAFGFSTNPTFVTLEKRKMWMPWDLKSVGWCAAWNGQAVTVLHHLAQADHQNPTEYGLRVTMQLCSAYSHWILDVFLVVTYSKLQKEKTCSSQSSCLGKRKPRRNDSRQLGTRYENDFYRTDIPQLLCYLSDFGEDGSMWWELVPTLWSKQKSSCSLKTTYTLPHAFPTLHMKWGWIRPTKQICSACQGWLWGRDKVRKKGSH